jgi:hypothetical protein
MKEYWLSKDNRMRSEPTHSIDWTVSTYAGVVVAGAAAAVPSGAGRAAQNVRTLPRTASPRLRIFNFKFNVEKYFPHLRD